MEPSFTSSQLPLEDRQNHYLWRLMHDLSLDIDNNNSERIQRLQSHLRLDELDWNFAPTSGPHVGKSSLWFLMSAVAQQQLGASILFRALIELHIELNLDLDWNKAPQIGACESISPLYFLLLGHKYDVSVISNTIVPIMSKMSSINWALTPSQGKFKGIGLLWYLMSDLIEKRHYAAYYIESVIQNSHENNLDWSGAQSSNNGSPFYLFMMAYERGDPLAIQCFPLLIKQYPLINWNESPTEASHQGITPLWRFIKKNMRSHSEHISLLPEIVNHYSDLNWNAMPNIGRYANTSILWFITHLAYQNDEVANNLITYLIQNKIQLNWNIVSLQSKAYQVTPFWMFMKAIANNNKIALDLLSQLIDQGAPLDWNVTPKSEPFLNHSALSFLMYPIYEGHLAAFYALDYLIYNRVQLDWHLAPQDKLSPLLLLIAKTIFEQNSDSKATLEQILVNLMVTRSLVNEDYDVRIGFYNNDKAQLLLAKFDDASKNLIIDMLKINYIKDQFKNLAANNNEVQLVSLLNELEEKYQIYTNPQIAFQLLDLYLFINDFTNAGRWLTILSSSTLQYSKLLLDYIKSIIKIMGNGDQSLSHEECDTQINAIQQGLLNIDVNDKYYEELHFELINLKFLVLKPHLNHATNEEWVQSLLIKSNNTSRREQLLDIFNHIVNLESTTFMMQNESMRRQHSLLRCYTATQYVNGNKNDLVAEQVKPICEALGGAGSNHNQALIQLRAMAKKLRKK